MSVGGSLYRATLSYLGTVVEQLVWTGQFGRDTSPMAATALEALLSHRRTP